ncbi:GEM-interacting protein, partial [Merops nubicus]
GLENQERAPESRKRYSEIFRGLDAIEISLGHTYVGKGLRNTPGAPGASADGPGGESLCKSKTSSEVPAQGDLTVQEADEMLIKCEGGIEAALE